MEPELLLLDEPVSGMNVEETEDMARFILDIQEELALSMILVEHDMGVVMDLADRVLALDFGIPIAVGPPAEIQHHPDVIRAYLGEQYGKAGGRGGRGGADRARSPGGRRSPPCRPDPAPGAGHPEVVALREKRFGIWQEVSWRRYRARSSWPPTAWPPSGVSVGDRVAIHSENRPQWLYADVATVALRAMTVELYPTSPPAEVTTCWPTP